MIVVLQASLDTAMTMPTMTKNTIAACIQIHVGDMTIPFDSVSVAATNTSSGRLGPASTR